MEVHIEIPCGCPCHGVRPRLGFSNTAVCSHCEGPNPTPVNEETPTLEEEWAYLQEELQDASETGWLEVSLVMGAVRNLLLVGLEETLPFGASTNLLGRKKELRRRIEELGT